MYSSIPEKLLKAARIGEGVDWEFKSARGGFPRSFWETYSAMANTDGGTIVFGAQEKNSRIRFDGLSAEQVDNYKKQLWDCLNNKNTVNVNLLQNSDIDEVLVDEGIVLCISVPPAGRRNRPVYCGLSPFGTTYRRNYEGDYRCTDEEVRRMFSDSDPDNTADMRILEGYSLKDIDQLSLRQYRQRMLAAKGDHPWLQLDDKELLEKIGGWRKDRKTSLDGLTVAGLLMFGLFESITDPDGVPAYWVDYRETLDPQFRWTDRVYPDGTWEPNLFQFYQRVWPKISTGLPVPFQLEHGVRKDETLAHEALREAFINALIHSDYRIEGGVVAIRSTDHFMFDNPGTLLVPIEQYYRGGISECRNKGLQKMFSMIGGGERAGSGVNKIKTGWNSRHWRSPWLDLQGNSSRTRLLLPMVSLIPDETISQLNKQFGNRVSSLLPDQIQALATAHIEGLVNNSRLKELTSLHSADISKMLQRLCDDGYLVSDNKKRWSSYRLNQSEVSNSSLSEGNSSLSDKKKRLPKQYMEKLIMDICQNKFQTLSDIAGKLNRNPRSLRNNYLSEMVKKGILELKHSNTPNNPNQAYRTVRR